jgi:hypothetical protein
MANTTARATIGHLTTDIEKLSGSSRFGTYERATYAAIVAQATRLGAPLDQEITPAMESLIRAGYEADDIARRLASEASDFARTLEGYAKAFTEARSAMSNRSNPAESGALARINAGHHELKAARAQFARIAELALCREELVSLGVIIAGERALQGDR